MGGAALIWSSPLGFHMRKMETQGHTELEEMPDLLSQSRALSIIPAVLKLEHA